MGGWDWSPGQNEDFILKGHGTKLCNGMILGGFAPYVTTDCSNKWTKGSRLEIRCTPDISNVQQ